MQRKSPFVRHQSKQADSFKRVCGTARRVWNWALEEWNRQDAAGRKSNAMVLKKAVQCHLIHRPKVA
ncbi:helix-turn-helix domain-containing protein [Methylacidiphilum kamchatkense]|uniref:helix-turn-helix domain-containing protein n=1 Tax=Methylacidiphilum kamchatkense TaxID=431057 RepID=UPI00190F472A